MINRDDAVQVILCEKWLVDANLVVRVGLQVASGSEIAYNRSGDFESVCLIDGKVITHTRFFGVKSGASKFFTCHYFSSSSLHKRWSTEEDCSFFCGP